MLLCRTPAPACGGQRCADPKILRPHQSADSDHRSASAKASAGRCCVGSAVSPRVRDSLSEHFPTGPSRSHVSNPSKCGWDTEVQLTAAAAEHGQLQGGGRADWDRARPSAL